MNPRPAPYKSAALTTELLARVFGSLLLLYDVASSFEVFDDGFWYAAPNGDAGLGQRVGDDVHLFLAV